MALRITHVVITTLLLNASAALNAQGPVSAAETAYRRGAFDAALGHLSNLRGLLAIAPVFDEVTGEDRERVLFDLARCRFALGDSGQARGTMDLPKDDAFAIVLSEMKQMRRRHRQDKINATSPLKAGFRSLIFPGWGQRYRGRRAQGNVISAAAGAFAIGWALADRSYRSSLDLYRRTSEVDLNLPARTGGPEDPNPFTERFAKVESRASRARALGVALASVWVYAITENFIVQPGRITLTLLLD